MTDTEKHLLFIRELAALTRKYGVAIHGCGCCSSPFTVPAIVNDRAGYSFDADSDGSLNEISWRDFTTEFEVKHYAGKVVTGVDHD